MEKIHFLKSGHPDSSKAYLSTLREILPKYRAKEDEDLSDKFERRVAESCGALYASAFNSTTIALKVFLSYADIKSGHQVICPSYMPIQYINAILDVGATPVFVDLCPSNYEMDFHSIISKISDKTRAILLAYPYGIPCNPKEYYELCKDYSIQLIELVLGGLGSKYQGKQLGTFGHIGIIEFHPKRSISFGDGGFLVSDNDDLASYARAWLLSKAVEGFDPQLPRKRISDFYASIGLWMIDRLGEAFFRQLQITKRYDSFFRSVSDTHTPTSHLKGDWNHGFYPVIIEGERRNRIADALGKNGIETHKGYQPAHSNTFIEALIRPPRLPSTDLIAESTLLLPIYPSLTTAEQDYIIENLEWALSTYRGSYHRGAFI
ncbi:MAG: DegT/DnrJ/EryC1/StrS family aminotransferase [Bdellovibrionales bacterium]|nr:DegT/DnrJ/EryC1/StrS family aminotransferase [Bdellovibrionales bacterium]